MGWIRWRGKELNSKTAKATEEALLDTAEEIGAHADQQVPHDEGHLQNSKYIAKDPSALAVHIGYGGGGQSGFPKVPYAVRHHEVPANFQKGRKHNYLRDPLKQVGPRSLQRNLKIQLSKTW